MKEIHIRSAVLEDLPVLYDFEQGIVQTERPWDKTLKPDPINYYDIKAMIESTDTEVIVAVSETELIGSAYARIEEAKPYLDHTHYAYLGFMFVKPEYRGQGVNKKIVEALTEWVRGKGLHEMRLDVYSDNDAAIRAYEKAGFEKLLINMRIGI